MVSSKGRIRFGLSGKSERPIVCVQGLGFVGAAMCTATALSRDEKEKPSFDVIGLDLDNEIGNERIKSINGGNFPFSTGDNTLTEGVKKCNKVGNLVATNDDSCLGLADIILIDVHLDVNTESSPPSAAFESFKSAIQTVAENMAATALVIVETTVPPGTCENLVLPIIQSGLEKRGLKCDKFSLAHSYERVMPGPKYLDSIINYWRVYAGINQNSASDCKDFLTKIINVDDYPLKELSSTTASETAKIIENTYRAVNIALMDEWGRFAEATGIDIFEIIDAIRQRPTHSNIRQPGFGVGGYCLTKDPFFGEIGLKSFFENEKVDFPFAQLAVRINKQMPVANLNVIEKQFEGGLKDKTLYLMGVAYRSEVDDTRYSASETFYREAKQRGLRIIAHDPLVEFWQETGIFVEKKLPPPKGCDLVVFCVPHKFYKKLDICSWLGEHRPFIYDADNVLEFSKIDELRTAGFHVMCTGKG